jgi:hypothetical protein
MRPQESSHGKFWLDPVRRAESGGFGTAEISRLEAPVRENAAEPSSSADLMCGHRPPCSPAPGENTLVDP